MSKVSNLEPKRVFHYFEEITKIPRCSFKEDKIADYLENFAKERNLDYVRDEHNNIVIRKSGSPGYENAEVLIIQGHMDMVCEKKADCDFDFDKDPIDFDIEGDIIIAKNTTLGADNGIAVAMALSILESDEIEHPPLEVLVTSNEESGMTGARNLDGSILKGKMLLNLDSESEGVACVACAGGQREKVVYKKRFKNTDKEKDFYEVIVSGLKGGHSGQEIGKGLGNSNLILARALYDLDSNFNIDLIDIEGGAKANAIPRYARAIISVDGSHKKEVQDLFVRLNKNLVKEFGKVDPDVRLSLEKTSSRDKVFEDGLKRDIINLLNILPNGVMSMSHDIDGLVGSSLNIGVIESDDEEIRILINIRSALESLRNEIARKNMIISNLCNGEYIVDSNYPAWEYKDESFLRDIAIKSYKKITNKELKLEAIHAGLECGLFKETIGDIDMLSIGPNIHGPHAPGESLEIASTKKVYELVLEILKNLK